MSGRTKREPDADSAEIAVSGQQPTSGQRPALSVVGGAAQGLSAEQRALVDKGRTIIPWCVQKLAPKAIGSEFDDLVKQGELGLIDAAKKFDSSRGASFSTYAKRWVVGAILRASGKEARESRLSAGGTRGAEEYVGEQPMVFDVAWDPPEVNRARLQEQADRALAAWHMGMVSEVQTPEDALVDREAHERSVRLMRSALQSLGKSDRRAVTLRYLEQRPVLEVARMMEIDERSVKRCVERGRHRLREILVGHGITEAPPLVEPEWARREEAAAGERAKGGSDGGRGSGGGEGGGPAR